MPPRRTRLVIDSALSLCVVLMLATGARASASPAPLTLGIQDPLAFQGGLPPDQQALALSHAQAAGARIVRLGVSWRSLVTTRPPSRAAARNPNWSGYQWDAVDSEVRAVVAAGMQPMLVPIFAPPWFEGSHRPSVTEAPPGTWRPSPAAFADFAHALAERYSGSDSDASGNPLPRVKYFEAWNEVNLDGYLNPQVSGRSAISPQLYRPLLNDFYASVKAVHRDNFVVAGALGPFGDYPPPTGGRLPPLYFERALLCVSQSARSARRCAPVHFDAFSVNEYPVADPRQNPLNDDDVRVRVEGVTRALALAAKAGTISKQQAASVWVTELAWNGGTAPRLRGTFTLQQQAFYLDLGLYMLWREGVRTVLWYNLRDQPTVGFTYRSGLYTSGDTVSEDQPKPALTAFRFPFLAVRSGSGAIAWGLAPNASDVVEIQQATASGGWSDVARLVPGSGRVFLHGLPRSGPRKFRALQGSDASLGSPVSDVKP